jgi:hypothetical protein
MSGSDPNNRRHPESTFSTEYPYNQATITRSGHEIHVNDAPGNESLKVAHTTGTYVEIEKTGRWVHTVVEKVYNYFKNTFTQTIDSHADIKVGGTYNFNVDKSYYENVRGKKYVGVGDDLLDEVGGTRMVHTSSDKNEVVNGEFQSRIKGDVGTDIGGSVVTNIAGTRTEMLNGDWLVTGRYTEFSMTDDLYVRGKNASFELSEEFSVKCNTMKIEAADTIEITAGGSITITTSGGPITVTAEGVVYINGTQIRLND